MSVTSGLEVGGPAPTDPFAAALEERGVTGGGDSAGVSVSGGLSFAGQETAPASADTAADGTDEEIEEGDASDPDIEAYLTRFDGDVDKALKAAAEAQKMIGRQANEVGELRGEVQKLTGRLEQLAVAPPAPAAPAVPLPNADAIEDGISEDPVSFITEQINQNAPDTYLERLFARYGEDDPYRAAVLRNEWQSWKTSSAAPATPDKQSPSDVEAYVQEQRAVEQMSTSTKLVQAEFDKEAYEGFKEYIPAALEASGKIVARSMVSTDPEEQQEAIRLVFRGASQLATAQAVKDATAAADAQRTAGKKTARVIQSRGGSTPAPPPAKGDPQSEEDAIKAFKDSLMGASTASVQDGLTFGK